MPLSARAWRCFPQSSAERAPGATPGRRRRRPSRSLHLQVRSLHRSASSDSHGAPSMPAGPASARRRRRGCRVAADVGRNGPSEQEPRISSFRRNPSFAGPMSAAERSRTSTGVSTHKALNLGIEGVFIYLRLSQARWSALRLREFALKRSAKRSAVSAGRGAVHPAWGSASRPPPVRGRACGGFRLKPS